MTEESISNIEESLPVQEITPEEEEAKRIEDLLKNYEFPPLIKRVQAIFADGVFIILIFFLTAHLIGISGDAPTWLRVSIFLFMLYVYEPLMVTFFGASIGHFLVGIRVKQFKNPEKNIMIHQAYFRLLLKFLLGWLSFITVTFNDHKRAIHDIGAGTIVYIAK